MRAAVGLPPREGVLVREVADGSPAATAGLLRGDLIVAAGGQPVTSIDDLLAAVDGVGADAGLPLKVVRATDEIDVTVNFAGA
jgi:serine protease Do